MTSVFPNVESLLGIYSFFAGCRYSDDLAGLSLFDGGTVSAYENYALIDPKKNCDTRLPLRDFVLAGLDFFAARGMPHIWPLFPGAGSLVGPLLEEHGAVRDAVFFDMFARSDAMRQFAHREDDFATVVVSDPGSARAWADAAWYGFDSGEPAPESFVRFTHAMIARPEFYLCALRNRDANTPHFAVTGMLGLVGGTAGIYYVATRPEYRRRGLALRVMKTLLDAADERGYNRVTLLATPSGRPLYEKCGFVTTGDVDIYRFGEA
ncbi:GNAT family N-acetyltransferase [Synergistaceae bacterium OttesenSCG-928-I11]|nr:GNAT family N-acetyltransferase [Synergistaceae bacterium OttesenSCG-928-I11]